MKIVFIFDKKYIMTLTLEQIEKRLNDFIEYQNHKIDIIANNPNRWMNNSRHELPSFAYYLENCVKDKGGNYDFTIRRYSTPSQTLKPISFKSQTSYLMDSKILNRNVIYSMWMGTPFNYIEVIK